MIMMNLPAAKRPARGPNCTPDATSEALENKADPLDACRNGRDRAALTVGPLTLRPDGRASQICERAQARIELVAERVADQVHGDDRQHDAEAGHRRDPPRAQQIAAPVAEIDPPLRRRRPRAEAEKAQRRAEDDRPRDRDR